ncbi:MAG: FHA domain-containing protein [Lachnospiraceae bacterium]|nr:FHA domain-containing protein [Lachnospiraceae bacterium]
MLKTKKIKKNIVEYLGPISISLYDWCKKPISKYEFFFVMEQIVDLSQRMIVEELNINHVILDMKNIYINKQTKELQFIYLPLLRSEGINNIVELMYNIIYSVTPMQEREDEYISRFAYYLQGLQHFESNKIENYIEKEESKVVNIIKKHHVGRSGFMTDKPKDYYEHYDRKSREDEPTSLLQENEETISIHKPVFRLGKEKSYSDYVIDNNAVSRSHANIITRGKRHFIMDLNSTNKTYINDVQIMARQERELLDGDKIRLGNEEFVFHF